MSRPSKEIKPIEWLSAEECLDDIDYHATELYFDRLLDLASDVCLRRPLPSLERGEGTLNQRLVAENGTLALRMALELNMGLELNPNYEDNLQEEELKDGQFFITLDAPLRDRGNFHDPIDLHIVRKAEQFGKALIDEAFDVLGDDAPKYVTLMQSDDPDKQMKAIGWLYNRINAMSSDEAEGPAESDAYLYHPIRLSPKAAGRYPDMEMRPTCLGASILMASFFEKAGVPYMHAGVAMSGYENQATEAAEALDLAAEYLTVSERSASTLLADRLTGAAVELRKNISEDRGYHAAVYVQRTDGYWVQLDPYFSGQEVEMDSMNVEVNAIYETLDGLRDDAPGLELSHNSRILSVEAAMASGLLGGALGSPELPALERAAELLKYETESVPQKVYEEIILPLFEQAINERKSEDFAQVIDVLLHKYYEIQEDPLAEDLVRSEFYEVFHKYVLWGEPLEKVQQRCRSDKYYLKQRLMDLIYAPKAMCASIALINTHENVFGHRHHQKKELGLPHARIGMAVLSDFAAYCDDTLPPSFWMGHWPSLVPITEGMRRADNNEYQRKLLGNMAIWTRNRNLTYVKADSIINEFLSAPICEEEETHGN